LQYFAQTRNPQAADAFPAGLAIHFLNACLLQDQLLHLGTDRHDLKDASPTVEAFMAFWASYRLENRHKICWTHGLWPTRSKQNFWL
jgi:hypothetical protein